jgi:hypothetical protein
MHELKRERRSIDINSGKGSDPGRIPGLIMLGACREKVWKSSGRNLTELRR